MKYSAVLATTILALFMSSLCLAGKPLKVGEKAPNWILSNGHGQDVSFYQDSGDHQAVILFWATWCPKCAELMPELKALHQALGTNKVKFYALNVWEDGDAPSFMAKNEYDFILLMNADFVAKRYSVKGTPGLIVVDENKIVRYVREKGTSAQDAAAFVKNALTLKEISTESNQ